jgi:tetratricopeptide (TPR) repeat protein
VPEGTTNIPGRTFQLLEASKQHLLEAFGLSTDDSYLAKSQLRNERQPSFGEWFYNYCSDLLNLVNVYVVEGEMFMEERCFRKIVQLVNKVERFYKEHSKEFKLKSVLSKCYYNKGVAYRVLKNYSEAEKYLKKDNSYCRKHGLTEELEKNRQEMYKLYV